MSDLEGIKNRVQYFEYDWVDLETGEKHPAPAVTLQQEDYDWLIEQAELVKSLTKSKNFADDFNLKRIKELEARIKELEKEKEAKERHLNSMYQDRMYRGGP